jgi:Flp pilus assembly protein TadG
MHNETRSMRGQRGNVLLLVTFSVPLLLGLVGLAIDGTMCFIVQAQLNAAIDGATLGTGRMLTGVTTDNEATDIAQAFMDANFRTSLPGLWGAQIHGTPTIVSQAATADITKSVQISATADVPLLFMRLLHFNASAAGAHGTATRRDARIEVILDRSGSMIDVLSTLKDAATTFTNDFTAGSDELGLIVYSNSAQVAYPPTTTLPYSTAMPTSGSCSSCGPDTHFKDNITDSMPNVIGRIADQNDTNMGDALALAYIELQKAHVRDLLLNPTQLDLRQNYIVLFTDGVPNTLSVYFNNPADPYNNATATPTARYVLAPKATTGCNDSARIDNDPNNHYPIMGIVESTQSTTFFQLSSLDPTNNSDTYVTASGGSSPDNTTASVPNPLSYGCTMSPNPHHLAVNPHLPNLPELSSLQSMPGTDQYGYSLGPNMENGTAGYKYSTYTGTIIYNGTEWGGYGTQASMANRTDYPTNTGNHATNVANAALNSANAALNSAAQYQWQMASWDVVDNIASAIRRDVNFANRHETITGSAPMVTTIMTVGYTGNGGTDAGLLSKVANVPNCKFNTFSCTVATQATGVYIQADNVADINTAFSTLMSTILRLSQ